MNKAASSLPQFDIPVKTTQEFTGNVTPLLHQIKHALNALIQSGEATTIDIHAMPLAPGELEHIETTLGVGEVSVVLNALGHSNIIETQYPGVWLISHQNTEGALLGKFIEVAVIPDILCAQKSDIQAGLEQLNQKLTESTSTEINNEAN